MGSLLAAIKIPDKPCPRFLRVSIETNTTKAYSGFYCITLFSFLGMLEHYRITPSMEFPGSMFTSGCSGGSRLCAKSIGGGGGVVLLSLPAFPPSVISSFLPKEGGKAGLPAGALL